MCQNDISPLKHRRLCNSTESVGISTLATKVIRFSQNQKDFKNDNQIFAGPLDSKNYLINIKGSKDLLTVCV